MDGYALGLIETRGKLAAIEAADVALKSANVTLCGVENATGALITVKVVGDVGAVRAAVDAARARASLLGKVVATRVLPRPAADIMPMVKMSEPVSAAPESASEMTHTTDHTSTQLQTGEERGQEPEIRPEFASEPEENASDASAPLPPEENEPADAVDVMQAATCNICSDPVCSRKKGEPSGRCIHHKKKRAK